MYTPSSLTETGTMIHRIQSPLLAIFGFVLPLSVALGNMVAIIITLLWLAKGDHKADWEQLKRNPVVISILCYYLLHIIGLVWTKDIASGLHILKKQSIVLLLPIFMCFTKKEDTKRYIFSFLFAIAITIAISFAIWFQVIPPTANAKVSDPTPFMSHISHNPFLTVALYLVLYLLLFDRTITNKQKIALLIFAIALNINMFITGGRAGQVMYFFMLTILLFQYFHKNLIKAVIATTVTIPLILLVVYNTSNIFSNRIKDAITDIKEYDDDKNTNVGLRLAFTTNSFDIIKNNPVIGVGTGDFNLEYEKVNTRKTPQLPATKNPHNMYVLEMVQLGILGLLSLLSILGSQFYQARKPSSHLQKSMGIALPFLFGIIMFSDAYLRGHYTTMLFVYFSSFLYKNYDEETN